MAINELVKRGAEIKNMMFVTVLSSPEGVAYVHSKYPDLLLLTGELDAGLNEKVLYDTIKLSFSYSHYH